MIKTICDKCGAEVKENDNELFFTGKRMTAHGYDKRYNLCDDCVKLFREWLKKK